MAAPDTKARRRRSAPARTRNGNRATGTVEISKQDLQALVDALRQARDGELNVQLKEQPGAMGDVAA